MLLCHRTDLNTVTQLYLDASLARYRFYRYRYLCNFTATQKHMNALQLQLYSCGWVYWYISINGTRQNSSLTRKNYVPVQAVFSILASSTRRSTAVPVQLYSCMGTERVILLNFDLPVLVLHRRRDADYVFEYILYGTVSLARDARRHFASLSQDGSETVTQLYLDASLARSTTS